MPVVFGAIVPNSPFLLPGLGKNIQSKIKKSLLAIKRISRLVRTAKPDVVFLIASRSNLGQPQFLQNKTFTALVKQYGDIHSELKVTGAVGFTHSLKESLEPHINIPLVSVPDLPIEFSAPLLQLETKTPVALLLLPTDLPMDYFTDLMNRINEYLNKKNTKVAVIACGLLSVLSTALPEKKIYDTAILNAISLGKDGLLNIDPSIKKQSRETIINPSLLLYALVPTDTPSLKKLAIEEYSNSTHLTSLLIW